MRGRIFVHSRQRRRRESVATPARISEVGYTDAEPWAASNTIISDNIWTSVILPMRKLAVMCLFGALLVPVGAQDMDKALSHGTGPSGQ